MKKNQPQPAAERAPAEAAAGLSIEKAAQRLRRRAEKTLQQPASRSKPPTELPPTEAQRMLHELQVHQVELETQNEELRRIRAELESTLERYTELYDFAPASYLTLTRDSTIRQANLAGASLLGIERARLLRRRFALFVSPEARPVLAAMLARAFETHAPQTAEVLLALEAQPSKLVLLQARASESGTVCRLVLTDITEIRQTDAALKQSEALLQAVSEGTTDAIYAKDRQGRYLMLNSSVARIIGKNKADLMGRDDHALFAPDDAVRLMALDREVMESGTTRTHEEVLGAGGAQHTFSTTKGPIRDARGEVVGLFGIARDITAQKQHDAVQAARLRLMSFAPGHSVAELLRATLDEAERLTGSRIGFYHFLQADQTTLSLQTWSTNTVQMMCTAEGAGRHYPVDQAGVWVDCIRARRPVVHNDYASLPHRKGLPPGHVPVVRQLVAPVLRHNRITALLGVGNKPTDYTTEEIQAIAALADLAWDIAERRRTEEALVESEARLLRAQAVAHVGNWELALATKTVWASVEAFQIYGIERTSPLLPLPQAQQVVLPEDRPRLDAALDGLLQRGASYDLEFRMVRANDRAPRTIHSLATLICDAQGLPTKVVGTIQDITERKQTEKALQQSETKYRALVENAHEAVFVVREGTLLFINRHGARLLGRDATELIGQSILPLVPEADRERTLADHRRLLRGDQTERYAERCFQSPDGAGRWIAINAIRIDWEGAPATLNFAMDITERRQAEVALAESQSLQRAVFDSTGDMIWSVDPHRFGLLTFNHALADYFHQQRGIRLELGLRPEDLFPSADFSDRWRGYYQQTLHSGPFTAEYQSYSGKVTMLLTFNLLEREAVVFGVSVFGKDITERKRAEQELLEHRRQLQSLAAELSRVEQHERRRLATLLHDDVIQALALSRIKLGALRVEVARPEHLAVVETIRQLLEQAIQSSRSLTFELSPPVLHELGLDPALDWLAEEFTKNHGLPCAFSCDGQPKPLHEDAAAVLFTAARELLWNAVKHAQATQVTVRSFRDADTIGLNVSDDGVGFDPAQNRLPSGRTGGFGLFNVRERLNYMRGTCEVRSQPGQGTCVLLRLPLDPPTRA